MHGPKHTPGPCEPEPLSQPTRKDSSSDDSGCWISQQMLIPISDPVLYSPSVQVHAGSESVLKPLGLFGLPESSENLNPMHSFVVPPKLKLGLRPSNGSVDAVGASKQARINSSSEY